MSRAPDLAEIEAARDRLGALVRETPLWQWKGPEIERLAGPDTAALLKLELFQHAGSFKPRGALTVMLDLPREALHRGITAFSAGNHALAVAYAAKVTGTTVKVVMPENANPGRVAACRAMGAEVLLVASIHEALRETQRIEAEEERVFVHPFEGRGIALGTATLGLELCRQAPDLDAVVLPIGGGGLCGGVSRAVKLLQPRCRVFGVEPEGADTMHRSFLAGRPEAIDEVRTIADSLGAPRAEPFSFALCRDHVDDLVAVSDAEMCAAMALLFREMKLAVEPAGAAATAALLGPIETFRNLALRS
jgi:threonine dehydratase